MKTRYKIKYGGFITFSIYYRKTITIFGLFNFTYWSYVKGYGDKDKCIEFTKIYRNIQSYFDKQERQRLENEKYCETIYLP